MALARFILIFLIIFLVIRLITRFIFKKYIKNMQERYQDKQRPYDQKREGDVTIRSSSRQDKKIDQDEGDYVDYEEVDDE
ncbi:MAG: hypothetical protein V2I54_10365 [Bacteroidales bacterium]|jgi:flagellar biosynthesis/type III secretory pathway M-ring protein FliF/YscJ|nr:hypothetical protein [Bacteroidales bacterium]